MLAVAPRRPRRAAADDARPRRRRVRSASSPGPAGSSAHRRRARCSICRLRFLHDGRPQRRDERGRARPPRTAGAAARSTIRRRRCSPCSPTRTSPQGVRSSIATTTRSAARRVVRAARRRRQRRPRRRRRARPTRSDARGIAVGIGSTRGTALLDPERDGRPSPSTRRSATSSPSAPTPTASPCSTTSRGATRAIRRRSARSSRAVAGCCDRRRRIRHAVRLGQGLAEQPYTGATVGATSCARRSSITAVAHVPDVDAA